MLLKSLQEMVEIPSDTDQMELYDVNHAIENEMCISNDYHSSNPNGIQNDAMNILTMSIEKCPTQFEGQQNSANIRHFHIPYRYQTIRIIIKIKIKLKEERIKLN